MKRNNVFAIPLNINAALFILSLSPFFAIYIISDYRVSYKERPVLI